MATCNIYINVGEIFTVVFEICERTDKQTDTLITILGTPYTVR